MTERRYTVLYNLSLAGLFDSVATLLRLVAVCMIGLLLNRQLADLRDDNENRSLVHYS